MTAAPADAPAPAFDRPDAPRLERPASDWTRDDTGRPQVLPDPDWTPETAPASWVGRDGELLTGRQYTRVTTFGEALLDGTMLARWKMRRVALGMGRRPDYVVAAAGLTAEDRDKAALNDLAEKALEAAGPNAADIGTALHSFTERIDRGEPVGEVPPAYLADLDAYRREVQRITWFHREERMVCDQLETAGTPDGLGMVDEPDPDGVVDLLRVIDLKTGNIETVAGKFSTQLGIYANSALYDPVTGKRTRLENLDTRWGVVLHMPAGVGTAELRWLNLQHGWLGAQLAGPVRKWRTVNYADLYRPLVKPEPRVVPDGKCAGTKRDGAPCTYKAVSGGYCGRHQDQVGSDPNAAVPARTQRVGEQLTEALQNVPEPLRMDSGPELSPAAGGDSSSGDASPAPVTAEDAMREMGLHRVGTVIPEHPAGTRPHWYASSTPGDSFAGFCLNCGLKRDDPASQHLGVTVAGGEPSTAVEPTVETRTSEQVDEYLATERCPTTDLLTDQCACPVHRPDLADTGDDGYTPDGWDPAPEPRELQLPEPNDGPGPDGHHRVTGECFACMTGVATGPESHGERCPLSRPEPRDRGQQPQREQQGNPTPHSGLQTPDDAAAAARAAEQGLLDQVRACHTTGELETLYQRTGFAWTPDVRAAATHQLGRLPQLAQLERTGAALEAAVRAAQSQGELQRLWQDPQNEGLWTPELQALAGQRHAQLPPF